MCRSALILSLFLMLGLVGCASMGTQEDTLIAHPPPPEEPRIVYVRSYSGGADIESLSFFDMIFGKKIESALVKPWGVWGSKGIIYVTDTGRGYVLSIDTIQKKVRSIGGTGPGRLELPMGIALAPNGILFVSDAKQKRVFGFDSNDKLKIALGQKGEFENPAGLAVDAKLGRLYIADSYGHKVMVYSIDGEKLFEIGSRGSKPGMFNYPSNIAVDRRNSNIYVTDTQNFRVQAFNQDGQYIAEVGVLGDTPGSFSRPKGVAVDGEGHLYVADAAFNNIQVFTENREFLLTFGSYGTGPDQIQLPAGMYIDEDDTIYITDQMNMRVSVYRYLSERWKKEQPEEYQKLIKQLEGMGPKQ